MHAPLAPDFAICDFSIRNKAHNTRMKFGTRTRISLRLKNGMNSLSNDLYENEMLFGYHINKYREICAHGMNSFQNESLLVSCE